MAPVELFAKWGAPFPVENLQLFDNFKSFFCPAPAARAEKKPSFPRLLKKSSYIWGRDTAVRWAVVLVVFKQITRSLTVCSRKFSKHHFSGVNSLLNFGGLFSLYSLANPLPSEPATTQDFSTWVT